MVYNGTVSSEYQSKAMEAIRWVLGEAEASLLRACETTFTVKLQLKNENLKTWYKFGGWL